MRKKGIAVFVLLSVFSLFLLSGCAEETEAVIYSTGYSLFGTQNCGITVTEQAFSVKKDVGSNDSVVTVDYKITSDKTGIKTLYFPYFAENFQFENSLTLAVNGIETTPSVRILDRRPSDITLNEYGYFSHKTELFKEKELNGINGFCYLLSEEAVSALRANSDEENEKSYISLKHGAGTRKIIFCGLKLKSNADGDSRYEPTDGTKAACIFVVGSDLTKITSPLFPDASFYERSEINLFDFFTLHNGVFNDDSSISLQLESLRDFLGSDYSGSYYYEKKEEFNSYILLKYDVAMTEKESCDVILKYFLYAQKEKEPTLLSYKFDNLSASLLNDKPAILTLNVPDMPYIRYSSGQFNENTVTLEGTQLSFSISSIDKDVRSQSEEKLESAIDDIYTIAVTSFMLYLVFGILLVGVAVLIIVAVIRKYSTKKNKK